MSQRFRLTRRAMLASTMMAVAAAPVLGTDKLLYKDATAPIEARVRDLLSRMTIEEKTAQLRSMWATRSEFLDAKGNFDPAKALKSIPDGIGQIPHASDRMGAPDFMSKLFTTSDESIAFINTVQKYHVEQTRLGIPAIFHEEAAHGFVSLGATVFPSPPALASTWDPALVEQAYVVAAREARVRGITLVLSPVLDLARDPRYGRVEEFFGEDPYLVGQMGIAAARGLQGPSRPLAKDRVFVTLKHFVHAVPQGGLNTAPANISERDLRENYLVPFKAVIRAIDPAVVMPSYNELGGVPSHANRYLLQAIGRKELGFKGAYFSDYGGVGNLESQHHMAADKEEAAILALKAGVGADLPEGESFKRIPDLVRGGRLSESLVDDAVAHVLRLKFEAGLFENPFANAKTARGQTGTPADIALARKVAQKAIVLLKNDGVLPLDPSKPLKLAVIGPNAGDALYGGYSAINNRGVSVLDGIKAAAGPNIAIEYAEGVNIIRPGKGIFKDLGPISPADPKQNADMIAAAAQVAARADVVFLALGDRPPITREATAEFMPGDRDTLGLYGDQDKLVEAVLAAGKPVIALLLNGRPLAVTRLADKANALVEGWYLGQEGGNAVADVLFGKVNPGGKLAVSFPRSVGDLPVFYNRHPSADSNHYVEGKPTPLFPLGHGLSYTSFDLSAPRLPKATIVKGDRFTVDVDVANTGKREGDEVVQLYIRDKVSSVPRPVLELKAFRRVTLAPGEKRTLTFDLGPDDLAFHDIDMNWTVEPGAFTIYTGNSSAHLKAAELTVN